MIDPKVGEFLLVAPTLKFFAPIRLNDEEGEELFNKLKPQIVDYLNELKRMVEMQFPSVRMGFEVE